jgi:membrane peptidoglycan carboxypeptidase
MMQSARTAPPIARLLILCVVSGLTVAAMALPFVGGIGLFARTATDSFTDLPSVLKAPPPPQRTTVVARDGTPIATFYAQNRIVVPLDKISRPMQHAIVAIEDARFFQHGAIDLKGTLRAAAKDVNSGGAVQGGSTLTQQYVKNALLYAADDKEATEDSISRKMREARYAIGVEKRLSKSEILNRYLNLVYFGEGAYGVEAAARRYFGEHASELTLRQSAMLAGLAQSPTDYDPIRNKQAALARRATVLERMAQVHMIPTATADRLASSPLGLHPRRVGDGCDSSSAPFFCDYLHHQLMNDRALGKTRAERERALMTGGLTIETTLDAAAQRSAQHAVDSVVPRSSRIATAVVAVKPGDGGVEAMAVDRGYGSKAKRNETRVNLALGGSSGFQAGSTFKMFTLAAALAKHVPLSQTFYSPPQVHLSGFHGCGHSYLGSWSPKNAEDGEGGTFGMVRATWESVNTYFAQLERKVGVCQPWRLAKKMGITEITTGGPPAQVPAFTLGSDDTSPLQVSAAYATLAAQGRYCAPYGVSRIIGPRGRVVQKTTPDCRRVMSTRVAGMTTSILRGVIDGPDSARTGASATIGRPAAGKTGTTDSFAAAWFTGFTPQLAASVWVGDPRGGAAHPLVNVRVGSRFFSHVYGADLPAAVWKATMLGALAGEPELNFTGLGAHVAIDYTLVRRTDTHNKPEPQPGKPPKPPKHIPPAHRR